ncbi:UDP-glucosyltransferase 2-like [Bicyclus anynana]|uniref:UDP-glucosyltransferase 2-like n=1 Tax=Bicyclus anynana TaxID=110368 RepID=A0A6J1PBB5_BICAN|nr:UDP-glucosyltransferase 2-like [Bicyclus anynana]
MKRFIFIIFSVILLCCHGEAANILGLFPITVRSHHMVYEPYLKRLAERGHNMTVASFFPVKDPPANIHGISLQGIDETRFEQINLNALESKSSLYNIPMLERVVKCIFTQETFSASNARICERLVDFQPFIDALKGEYDLVLTEHFLGDCALALYRLYGGKAPILAVATGARMPWTMERIGAVDNPSYVPIVTSTFKSEMSFMERMENTLLSICLNEWFTRQITMKEKKILETRFGNIPDLNELARNASMIFLNTFHVLNGAMPLVPGLIEVGGMHLSLDKKPVPQVGIIFLHKSTYPHKSVLHLLRQRKEYCKYLHTFPK